MGSTGVFKADANVPAALTTSQRGRAVKNDGLSIKTPNSEGLHLFTSDGLQPSSFELLVVMASNLLGQSYMCFKGGTGVLGQLAGHSRDPLASHPSRKGPVRQVSTMTTSSQTPFLNKS